jgi:hypothetical protein
MNRLNESYILILSSVILSMGNFVLWWLLFDEEFDQRIEIYYEAYREQMKRENEEFVAKMQDIIDLDPEAVEIAGFGEKWREKLENVNKLRMEADAMRKRVIWVYYFALGAILFAAGGLVVPGGVPVTDSFTLYSKAISWWVLVVGVLTMVGLLVHYQLIENKSQPRTEGEPIRDGSSIQSVIDGLRSKLPL